MENKNKPTKSFEDRVAAAFEFMVEAIGWMQIMISPFLIGIVLGAIIYAADQTVVGLVLGLMVAAAGFIVGAIWATNKWRGKGTVQFMSRLIATPEYDEPDDDPEAEEDPIKRK